MARPLRIEYENAYYHVINRGKGRQRIFHDSSCYEAFLKGLTEAHLRFGLEVHAYCLMANHYHLLIKTPRANLSRIMRHIDGLYTQRHNRLRQTDGPLFRGRYKAIVIDVSCYLLQVSRYIHRNPIETRTPIVEELADYPWSSYPSYLDKGQMIEGLNRDTVFAELGSHQRYSAYQRFVLQGNDPHTQDFYQLERTPAVMGDRAFLDRAREQAQSLDQEIDKQGLKNPVDLERIVKAVADYYQVPENGLRHTARGKGKRNIPRWVAMKLCQEIGSAKLTEIANYFQVGHYSTVSQTIGRLNGLMRENSEVANTYNVLSQDLTPLIIDMI